MRDVIVIGAGGGGPVVAKELAEQGLDVLLLEGGRRNENTDQNYTHYEGLDGNRITGITRNGPSDPNQQAWFREVGQNAFIWDAAGVGGTTQAYFGNCPRSQPGAFVGFAGDGYQYDDAHLFPFTYEELLPYYRWVEKTLPVQTAAMGTKEALFYQGCQAIGLPLNATKDIVVDSFRPNENAILQPQGNAGKTTNSELLRFPQAQGCTFCGYCSIGCNLPKGAPRNLKAKRSTHNSYVPMALTADLWSDAGKAITLMPDAKVISIVTDSSSMFGQPKASGVRWRNTLTGEQFEERAKVVVLAAGSIESPRIWLNSNLPNPNGWVGKGLTDHAMDWVTGVFDEPVEGFKGAAAGARADFPGRGCLDQVALGPAFYAFSLAFSDSGIRGQYTNGRSRRSIYGKWDGPSGRVLGRELKQVMGQFQHATSILVITDDDVEEQNRIELSDLVADQQGPVARIKLAKRKRSKRTLANREFLANKSAEILRAAGAKKVLRLDWPGMLLHMQSSMRMGLSEADSVLDENAQSRWVEGLYVADNSALANGCGGSNPTLTTQALATRTAEKIMQTHFGAKPWVGTREPLSSVDESVTEAVLSRGIF